MRSAADIQSLDVDPALSCDEQRPPDARIERCLKRRSIIGRPIAFYPIRFIDDHAVVSRFSRLCSVQHRCRKACKAKHVSAVHH
jgi:hypothetical protein